MRKSLDVMPSDRSGMWSSQDEAVISSQRKDPKSRRHRDQLKAKIHRKQGRQKSEIKHLQSTNDIIILRAATLDDWSGQRKENSDLINERNILAHGGKIAADIETIRTFSEFSPQESRITKWKKEFRERYGIRYEDIASKIDDVSEALLTILDRRASVLSLDIWARHHVVKRRDRIVHKADIVIQNWHKHPEELLQEGSQNKRLYDQIQEDWYNGPW
ncbi:hypothetical protein DTO271D3_4326 [Paecilomyces variotii]|nr:hypothetical protein DTO271D3_4326 [Paecilomyces variotii]